MTTNHSVQKALKTLYAQMQGMVLAYDSALLTSDALFASAILRNLFQGNTQTTPHDLVVLLQYIRGNLKRLDDMTVKEIMGGRRIWDTGVIKRELEGEKKLAK